MNIKFGNNQNKNKIVDLSESQQFETNQQAINNSNDEYDISKVMENTSLQFKFDCGAIMAKINLPVNNKFGLKWHFDNSNSVEEFINSVENYLKIGENQLTENDKNRLIKQYNINSK